MHVRGKHIVTCSTNELDMNSNPYGKLKCKLTCTCGYCGALK